MANSTKYFYITIGESDILASTVTKIFDIDYTKVIDNIKRAANYRSNEDLKKEFDNNLSQFVNDKTYLHKNQTPDVKKKIRCKIMNNKITKRRNNNKLPDWQKRNKR